MVDGFLRKVKDAIVGNEEEFDQEPGYNQPRPASEDPYGDPAGYGGNDGQFGDVRPASEDPYGDPADSMDNNGGQFGDVRPASEDPYGDPADQENY
jgi:hypothetical protein